MIKTRYSINFIVDDESFNIEVKDPSLKEKKELEDMTLKSREALDEFNSMNAKKQTLLSQIEYKKELIRVNKELLKQSPNKFELLSENKTILKEIADLDAKLKSLKDINLEKINDELESVLEYKNNLLISGDDKERLLSALKEKGISNQKFWEILGLEVAKEMEKK
ncbi:hypothetical protein [Campylobacter corcagiensis]|uniref:Uncharacterized protein n=1 Tax=Campylobacter corcagiensis TaxID=1448857 RepID=A0A7M1LFC9_9BACT|nr:hypothetical protein [Campylobacter corcagiensis]QKF64557.1 hypothetical protein CCORG_0696 [Campylobacter corcagiensis]QOQ87268.1 hypothetical protein IMC76_08690 [Campylobacter corcagiensis]